MRLRTRRIRKEQRMKCVRKDDKIKRVPDSEAEKLVREKGWKYVPRSEWKHHGREYK